MDLGSFLADDTLGGGSWADEDVDMSSIGVPMTTAAPISNRRLAETSGFNRDSGFGSGEPRREQRERQEYPIPDHPPFRARVGNLAWEADEESLVEFFEIKLGSQGIVSDVKLPVDNQTGRLRGFGFLTFDSRSHLEEALRFSFSDFNGRKIYVDVAAPEKADVFEMDWRGGRGPLTGGRGGDRGDRPPRREEADLDWGSARGSGVLPPREHSNRDRGDRPPRREEPQLDWGVARGSGTLPPREHSNRERGERTERPPRKEEPELDWGSARGSGVLPPRENSNRERAERTRPKKQEPELDWGVARGTGTLPPRERSNRQQHQKKPEGDNLDWKRGQPLGARTKSSSSIKKAGKEDKKDQPKPQKSSFDVLSVDDSDEEEESASAAAPAEDEVKVEDKEEVKKADSSLEKATAELSIEAESKDSDDWEVVKK